MNLNETVRVKWTEAGMRLVEQDHRETLGELSDRVPVIALDTDSDGYASIQLWQLMALIGPKLHQGMIETFIEKNEIVFPHERER